MVTVSQPRFTQKLGSKNKALKQLVERLLQLLAYPRNRKLPMRNLTTLVIFAKATTHLLSAVISWSNQKNSIVIFVKRDFVTADFKRVTYWGLSWTRDSWRMPKVQSHSSPWRKTQTQQPTIWPKRIIGCTPAKEEGASKANRMKVGQLPNHQTRTWSVTHKAHACATQA